MFHTVYQTTNTVNGKIYIGKHSSKNPDDSYKGSGRAITRAFAKHNKRNFTKVILFYGFSTDDAFWFESQIVDDEFIKRCDTYNEVVGGKGSAAGVMNVNYGRKLTDDHKAKMSAALTGMKREPCTDEIRANMSQGQRGKRHSQATKDKMSASRKGSTLPPTTTLTKVKQAQAKIKYTYEILTPSGDVVQSNSIEQFCKDNGLNSGNMYGPAKKSKGYSIVSRNLLTPSNQDD